MVMVATQITTHVGPTSVTHRVTHQYPTSDRRLAAQRVLVDPVCFSDIGPTSVFDVNPMYFSDIGKTHRIYEQPMSGKTSVRRRILMSYLTSYRCRADLLNSRLPDVCL